MSVVVVIHLAVALSALLIGGIVLRLREGTARHKLIGRVWEALMLVVAVGSFWLVEINDGAWMILCLRLIGQGPGRYLQRRPHCTTPDIKVSTRIESYA